MSLNIHVLAGLYVALSATACAFAGPEGDPKEQSPPLCMGSLYTTAQSGILLRLILNLDWGIQDAQFHNFTPRTNARVFAADLGFLSINESLCRMNPFMCPSHTVQRFTSPEVTTARVITTQPNPLLTCLRMRNTADAAGFSYHENMMGNAMATGFITTGNHYERLIGHLGGESINLLVDQPVVSAATGSAETGLLTSHLTVEGDHPTLAITIRSQLTADYLVSCNSPYPGGAKIDIDLAAHLRFYVLSNGEVYTCQAGLVVLVAGGGTPQSTRLLGLFSDGLPTPDDPLQINVPLTPDLLGSGFELVATIDCVSSLQLGDVNHDGVIDSSDKLIIATLNGVMYDNPLYRLAADLNFDGVIDTLDLTNFYLLARTNRRAVCGLLDINCSGSSCFARPCNPADIATTGGIGLPDQQLDNGDFALFISAFFGGPPPGYRFNPADIADSSGEPGPDGQVDNGDWVLFMAAYFQGCN